MAENNQQKLLLEEILQCYAPDRSEPLQIRFFDCSMIFVLGRLTSLVLAIAGFPLHCLICICIWLADHGSPLYRALRMGQNGVPFEMLKYRSMHTGSAPVVSLDFKVDVTVSDPRVTTVGRLIRCGIDELPQITNIIRGEMAWVGPRPDDAWMLENYGPMLRTLLALRPGITGLAQVCNSRQIPTARSYAIDIWYVRYRTLWLDLWILLATPVFIIGVRSVGTRRLRHLLSFPELTEIERACQLELDAARVRRPTSSAVAAQVSE
jgi:lipopolysaccharide/colanic/teichoic acid biosynthesis glycosyltransferase